MSKFDPYSQLKVSLNGDGSLTRYLHWPRSPATGDPPEIPGLTALSKDLTLNDENKTWMRIYRPAKLPFNGTNVSRLPIMIFFHHGTFIYLSGDEIPIHERSNRIAVETPCIIVMVAFRLPPEHRLPAQYEDAVEAVSWIRNQAINDNGEPWIKDYGDVSRCYLYGISSGGNIAFNAALWMTDLDLRPLKIVGMILNQPYFGGQDRTDSELQLASDLYLPLPMLDCVWELVLPLGSNRNHPYCNPLVDGPMKDRVKKLAKCMVIGFGGDPMVDRQEEFVEMLVQQGVKVEARFDDIGFHGVDLVDSKLAVDILNLIKDFVV